MEAKTVKVLTAASVLGLVILLIVLWLSLGHTKTFFIVAGLDLALILAILLWVLVQYAALDRRQKAMARRSAVEGEELRIEYSFLRRVAGVPIKFQYEDLAAATDSFQSLLGRGSSASVFKGILEDGTAVAVKRIEEAEHSEREFRSEVSAVASIQHVHLVRLLGYCLIPHGPRYLVYEFVENGSLDLWIFAEKEEFRARGRRCLPWPLRYRVAIDVAKALAYLHDDCRSRILHLDVKPENILLDESFRAIVTDFGLSKLMRKEESRVVTTVRGTRGYLAPEWLIGSGVSEKSDVYSYGMVLLELVGGRRNVLLVGDGSRRKWSYFPRIVSEKVRQGRVMDVVDERLRLLLPPPQEEAKEGAAAVDEREVRTLVYVALWCIQENARARPSMARVVDMLEGRMAVDQVPLETETEMMMVDLLHAADGQLTPRGGGSGAARDGDGDDDGGPPACRRRPVDA